MIDANCLNEARWAACNTRYPAVGPPTMEWATALADKIVCAYLGLSPEDWEEALDKLPEPS